MARRSQTLGITDRLKLAGGHRAHSDVTATHQILREIARHGIVLAVAGMDVADAGIEVDGLAFAAGWKLRN